MSKYRNIILFGSDNLSVSVLRRLNHSRIRDNLYENISICYPSKQISRRVKQHIITKELEALDSVKATYEAPQDRKFRSTLWDEGLKQEVSNYDLGIVISFGYYLPDYIVNSFKHGCINIHPSLLPRYKGASPIAYPLINGDDETGVSIIEVDPIQKADHGTILNQQRVRLSNTIRYEELSNELITLGGDMLIDTMLNLNEYRKLNKVESVEQTKKQSYAPKIKKSKGTIDLTKSSAIEIYNLWRAIGHNIGITCKFDKDKDVILMEMEIPSEEFDMNGDDIQFDKDNKLIKIKTKNGYLICTKFKFKGSKAINAVDFYNSYVNKKIPQPKFY